uniref:Protein kinase domain-containing protein n=1 Tax=Oryza punctata TaxID=4537 RepID=A0A0E0LMJ5_ORYPU
MPSASSKPRGVLHKSKMEIAVKKFSHESRQGMKEFIAEVASIGRLRHRNLVQLLGYCRCKGELLLVYDYMPNNSLDKYLYNQSTTPLDWSKRFQIIRGVASGLLYLHKDWEQVVIHRVILSQAIEMNPRLGDFGLARLYDHGADARTTHIVGTIGYQLAPELGHTGRATPTTDVFAFGVFLLEVTSGRRPLEKDEQNKALFGSVHAEHKRGELGKLRGEYLCCARGLVDARLPDGFNPDEVALVLKLLCSHRLPNRRPTMRHVIHYLDGDRLLPDLSPLDFSFTMLELSQQNVTLDILSLGIEEITDLGRVETKPVTKPLVLLVYLYIFL